MRQIVFKALVWKWLVFFVMLLIQDRFESGSPEKLLQKQPYADLLLLQVFLELSQCLQEKICVGVSF